MQQICYEFSFHSENNAKRLAYPLEIEWKSSSMTALFRAISLASISLFLGLSIVNGKFLVMRPLNAREVYRLLRQSGRSDAVPQGRVITQGLAAMTGFALGLTKGLGGALLYDIITANVTDLDLNNGNSNGNSNGNRNRLKTQEVCFSSRNARSLEEAEAIAEAYGDDDDDDGRDDGNKREKHKIQPSKVERRLLRKRRNKRKSQRHRKPATRLILKKHSLKMATGTQARPQPEERTDVQVQVQVQAQAQAEATSPTTMATGKLEKSPATSASVEATPTVGTEGSGTNTDNGDGTGTYSMSTTSTGNDGTINCIVIEKPESR